MAGCEAMNASLEARPSRSFGTRRERTSSVGGVRTSCSPANGRNDGIHEHGCPQSILQAMTDRRQERASTGVPNDDEVHAARRRAEHRAVPSFDDGSSDGRRTSSDGSGLG
jgi:hypothetical protein